MKHWIGLVLLLAAVLLGPSPVHAQVPDRSGSFYHPRTLGEVINQFEHIAVLEVMKVDRNRGAITFRRMSALKGNEEGEAVEHDFSKAPPEERRDLLTWARPGRMAVSFRDDTDAMVCIGNFWYAVNKETPERWTYYEANAASQTYVGSVERLRDAVCGILAGKEEVITAVAPRNEYEQHSASPLHRNWLRSSPPGVWRIKASLKINDINQVSSDDSPHFVGWGPGGAERVPACLAALKSADPLARAEAASLLGQLVPGATGTRSALEVALGDEDPHVRIAAADTLVRSGGDEALSLPILVAALKDADVEVRRSALLALADVGRKARPAAPALCRMLREDGDATTRAGAAFALGQLAVAGPGDWPVKEAVAALGGALLEEKKAEVRQSAVRALLKFGPDAGKASAELAAALRDENGEIAQRAADVLARLGPSAVPILAKALRDPRCAARTAIVDCLGDLGRASRPAVPELVALLKDAHPSLVMRVAEALAQIDRSAAGRHAVPPLLAILQDDEWKSYHFKALLILGKTGPDARSAGSTLCILLKSEKDSTRLAALKAIEEIGVERECRERLIKTALADEEKVVRMEATTALYRAGAGRHAVAILTDLLRQDRHPLAPAAARRLGQIGPAAADALPLLRRLMHSKEDVAPAVMALAYWHIASPVEGTETLFDPRQEAVDVLQRLAQHGKDFDRCGAIDGLRQIAAEDERARRTLRRLLSDSDEGYRQVSAWALGECGANVIEATPDLERLLNDDDVENRRVPAIALLQIGGSREECPALARLIDRQPWLVLRVSKFGPGPRKEVSRAVPFLLQMLRHDDRRVYLQAAAALRKIDPKGADRAGVP